jgi:hypothetical protein
MGVIHAHMPDRLGEYLPDSSTHRLEIAYALAIVGILAVGDGLNVIYFPMYQLGLPDTTLANTLVTVGGIGLFVGAYRLAASAVTGPEGTASSDETGGVGTTADGDPVAILKRRYALGEVSDAEFERKLDRLEASDEVDFDPSDRQTVVEDTGFEESGLVDRQTAIE